jgi:type II secretory ATPase GspE/PulE/Tfp pilus assembly ATPase PilB-like protein
VNVKAGVTYESGLRSLLRQDPDVILVGEMRDVEAAQLALRAALTGRLDGPELASLFALLGAEKIKRRLEDPPC